MISRTNTNMLFGLRDFCLNFILYSVELENYQQNTIRTTMNKFKMLFQVGFCSKNFINLRILKKNIPVDPNPLTQPLPRMLVVFVKYPQSSNSGAAIGFE